MSTTIDQNRLDLVHRTKSAAAEAAFDAALRETGDVEIAVAARDGAMFAVRAAMLPGSWTPIDLQSYTEAGSWAAARTEQAEARREVTEALDG